MPRWGRHQIRWWSLPGNSEHVLPVVEDFSSITLPLLTRENWNVRSGNGFAEMPNGGAIFSTGSIAWRKPSHNNYQNNAPNYRKCLKAVPALKSGSVKCALSHRPQTGELAPE